MVKFCIKCCWETIGWEHCCHREKKTEVIQKTKKKTINIQLKLQDNRNPSWNIINAKFAKFSLCASNLILDTPTKTFYIRAGLC